MEEVSQITEREVKTLEENIKDMTKDMRLFSLTLRSLYVQNEVGTSEELAKEFRRLRYDTSNDAMVYLKGILPVSTKFISSISQYFGHYESLDYKEWYENLPDILQETRGYKELCKTILKMHEDILVPLKKRQDKALDLVKKFQSLKKEYEEKKRELEEGAQRTRNWAIVLSYVPHVGHIAKALMDISASFDMENAVAKGRKARIEETASLAVSEALIPALGNFIKGISTAAGFFSVMEQELENFQNTPTKTDHDPKKLHYDVMRSKAKGMKSTCESFYAVLPVVKTDLQAIPTEETDKNYVDQWLEEQKKTIREKCSVPNLAEEILKAINDEMTPISEVKCAGNVSF